MKAEIKAKIKFFLEKKGIKEIVKIHRIKVGFRKVIIYTERPGMLIGKRGENYNELKKELGLKIKIIEFDPFSGTYCK